MSPWRTAHNLTAVSLMIATSTGVAWLFELSRADAQWLTGVHGWLSLALVPALAAQILTAAGFLIRPPRGRPFGVRMNAIYARTLFAVVLTLVVTGCLLHFDSNVHPSTRIRIDLAHRAITDLLLAVLLIHVITASTIRLRGRLRRTNQ